MVGVDGRVLFDTFWTHELETGSLSTKISDGFLLVLVAGNVVGEVGLHVFESKSSMHFVAILI